MRRQRGSCVIATHYVACRWMGGCSGRQREAYNVFWAPEEGGLCCSTRPTNGGQRTYAAPASTALQHQTGFEQNMAAAHPGSGLAQADQVLLQNSFTTRTAPEHRIGSKWRTSAAAWRMRIRSCCMSATAWSRIFSGSSAALTAGAQHSTAQQRGFDNRKRRQHPAE